MSSTKVKKSHYLNTEKLDKLEEKFRLLEEEIDDLTDKALEIKWELEDIIKANIMSSIKYDSGSGSSDSDSKPTIVKILKKMPKKKLNKKSKSYSLD